MTTPQTTEDIDLSDLMPLDRSSYDHALVKITDALNKELSQHGIELHYFNILDYERNPLGTNCFFTIRKL